MKYKTISIKDISLMGMYLSFYLLLGLVPNIGLIYIPPIYLTTFPILMFIIIFIHQDFKYSLFAGFGFGITSLIMAAMRPIGNHDWLYLNPLISILPRVIWSLLVYFAIIIGPKKWIKVFYLLVVIFITYWIHSFISDFFKYVFYVWIGGYSWHNNSLLYSLFLVWGFEHLIEISIYCAVTPLILIKTLKSLKRIVKIEKETVVFDYSRTIAFGEGKTRKVPSNIIDHLILLKSKYNILVITGRKNVDRSLKDIGIDCFIYSNGRKLEIQGNSYYGYINLLNSGRKSAINLFTFLTNSKIKFLVTDNGKDLKLEKSYKILTVDSHHKKLDHLNIYKFDKKLKNLSIQKW